MPFSWNRVSVHPPAPGIPVETKIHDEQGERNHQVLVPKGRLWFLPDMSVYVYYTPTHWRPVDEAV